jgi:hypothetical protein
MALSKTMHLIHIRDWVIFSKKIHFKSLTHSILAVMLILEKQEPFFKFPSSETQSLVPFIKKITQFLNVKIQKSFFL